MIRMYEECREELEVEVFAENAIGRSFYARNGFMPIGKKFHKEAGFELIRLRLNGRAE